MFIRRKKNNSGSTSIYILKKESGRQILVKSMGSAKLEKDIVELEHKAQVEISKITNQVELGFDFNQDKEYISFFKDNVNHVRIIGTELILNNIFNDIGFDQIPEELFRYLVLSRVVYPGSKLQTIEYLSRHHQKHYSSSTVYRYMDRLNDSYKDLLQKISYTHTLNLFGGFLSVVFYDVTTLYFEASKEDELRKIGYSKDGKSHNPQIVLGLLVSKKGYPLAFEMYKGNQYEGHTMIPILDKFKSTFKLKDLVVIADSGLMSRKNIEHLKENNYKFIIGARIKNESSKVKNKILSIKWREEVKTHSFDLGKKIKLVVSHSKKRAKKDSVNREKGIERLQSKIVSGKLTKQSINNRGYNKFLKIEGTATVDIDLSKIEEDKKWDGLKGYITNTSLSSKEIIENYHQLWHIERAFRMSKTDLKVRPIYHRKSKRIESHLVISFCSYKVYKELERLLVEKKIGYSPEKTISILKSIYGIKTKLPYSKKTVEIIMANTEEQKNILEAFEIKY